MKHPYVYFAAIALTISPALTFAEPPHNKAPDEISAGPDADDDDQEARSPKRFHAELMEGLNLTPEQREKFKAVHEKRRGVWEKYKTLHDKREELIDTIKKPSASESEVMPLVDSINDIQSTLNKERVKNMLEVKKILTPDQFATMVEKLKERKKKWKGRWGHE
jgi:Spy/CpxP family protein refolding chaperone